MLKKDIDKIYLNKEIDNNIILKYISYCFYSLRINNLEFNKNIIYLSKYLSMY